MTSKRPKAPAPQPTRTKQSDDRKQTFPSADQIAKDSSAIDTEPSTAEAPISPPPPAVTPEAETQPVKDSVDRASTPPASPGSATAILTPRNANAANAAERTPVPPIPAAPDPITVAPKAATPGNGSDSNTLPRTHSIVPERPDLPLDDGPSAGASVPPFPAPSSEVRTPAAGTPPETVIAPAEPPWEPQQVVEPEPLADLTPIPSAPESAWPPEPEPQPAPIASASSMFIVHITPELAPVAKVGGLADVVFGLGKELEIRGNHVEIVLPKYDCLRYDHVWGLTETYNDLWVPWFGGAIHCTVYFGFVHGRKCFFIEPHSADNFFNRGGIYGFNDDVLRFAFFSRAALEFLWKSGKQPDIIHCHDWQTALVPVFLFEIYQQLGMTHPRVCFTIHNFKHQGVTGTQLLHATGLNRPEYYFHYDRLRDNHNPHALNLMKGGVVYANFVTTVSPRHAAEAKEQGQGFGLEPTLHIHHQKYGGVVNGIDYDVWNPEVDHYLPFRYSLATLDDKYKNKRALRDRLMIADNEKPIVAFIGRLDPQKGLELVRHGIFYTLHRGGQFVLLGSSPDGQINNYFWGLKHQLNENPDCHLEIGFNEELAHLIYAGADMVIVPSRFEPCGLTQLIAMRYGTVPIVREVGGLADTVFDKDYSHRPLHERNGYTFLDYNYGGLESALGRAVSCYYQFPEHFRELMKNCMRFNFSWQYPGQDYVNIYDYIREK